MQQEASVATRAPGSVAVPPARAHRPQFLPARRRWALPTALGLFATALSLLGSWIPSLWGDEAASLLSATRPLGSLFMMLGHVDAVHGTYYLGLHAWIDVFGSTPFSLRLPSAIAVGLGTAAAVVLARRLSTTTAAVVVGIICALLPRLTYAGEEARSYAFSAAIAAWLTVLLVELLARHGRGGLLWVAYGALLAFGIYTFLYLGLIIAAHAVILLSARPRRRLLVTWMIACVAALLVCAPIIAWAFTERAQVAYLATRTEVSAQSILVSLWFGYIGFAIVGWLLMIIAVGAAGIAWLRRRVRARADVAGKADLRLPSLEWVAACWLIIPSALLILPSSALADFTARYLTFCAPAAAILIACGIVRIATLVRKTGTARTITIVAATACVVAVAVPAYLSQRTPYAKNNSDWAEISAVLGAHASPGEAVAFDASTRPSRRPRLAMHTYPAGFTGLQDVLLKTPYMQNTSWSDTAYTITQADALGRFAHVSHLWVVEYAAGTHVDTWGMTDLKLLGFSVSAHYRNYRSEVIELSR